ncbi:MAG: hypothetical protein K8823_1183 [Cenarchaeum symbiont of Oopsacas minuta]|nr:hypothetical protein [Cenarchaeum symbiont of Oopsacas minuta]
MNNEEIEHICPRSENLEKEIALLRKENKQQGETMQQQGKTIREYEKTTQQQGETIQQSKNEIEELKITINALVARNIRVKPNKPDSDIKLQTCKNQQKKTSSH